MKIVTYLIIVLFLYKTTLTYPMKPLNERETVVAWQAWLVVDQNNNDKSPSLLNNNNHDQTSNRRRIRPKSVFITPNFNPDTLPECADGYRSDSMGRCVKIIKLNEDAHLNFLLDKLNKQFGSYDYEEAEDDEDMEDDDGQDNIKKTTQGPLQVNIPLLMTTSTNNDDPQINKKQMDDKIVVDDGVETDVAIVVAPTNGGSHFFDQKHPTTTTAKADVKRNEEGHNMMTSSTTTTDVITTTTINDNSATDYNTEETTTTLAETTTATDDDDDDDGEAIFFLNPTTITTTTTDIDLDATTTVIQENDDDLTTSTTTTLIPADDETTTTTNSRNRIRFPTAPEDHDWEFLIENNSKSKQHAQRDTLIQQFDEQQSSSTTGSTIVNHRNRDKFNKLFLLPERWSESSPRKPLVLRFSRKHGYMDTGQFNQNENYFRELQGDNLSYLFGFKQNSHHNNNNR